MSKSTGTLEIYDINKNSIWCDKPRNWPSWFKWLFTVYAQNTTFRIKGFHEEFKDFKKGDKVKVSIEKVN